MSQSRWVRVLSIGGNYALLTLGDESWETAYCTPAPPTLPALGAPPFGNSLTWPLWDQLKTQRKASRRGAVVSLGHGWRSLSALLWLKANSLNGTAKQISKGAGAGTGGVAALNMRENQSWRRKTIHTGVGQAEPKWRQADVAARVRLRLLPLLLPLLLLALRK